MKRRPRRLFKAQRRGPNLYLGPEYVGPEPRYLPMVDALAKQAAEAVGPGEVAHVLVYHDAHCAIFGGGPCDCDPEVRMAGPGEVPA